MKKKLLKNYGGKKSAFDQCILSNVSCLAPRESEQRNCGLCNEHIRKNGATLYFWEHNNVKK